MSVIYAVLAVMTEYHQPYFWMFWLSVVVSAISPADGGRGRPSKPAEKRVSGTVIRGPESRIRVKQ